MPISPRQVIQNVPPALPRTQTLITAARQPPDEMRDVVINGTVVEQVPSWTAGFVFAPENCGPGGVRDSCDGTSYDLPAVPPPTGVTATGAATGGTVPAGAHGYRVTYLAQNGETLPSNEATVTTSGTTSTVTVTFPAPVGTPPAAVSGARIYGRTVGGEQFIASVGKGVTSYTDTGAITPSGALPTADSTAGSDSYANAATVAYDPFIVDAVDTCSSFGFAARDYVGRATRQLRADTPFQVAREFWTGALAQAKGYPNRYLAGPGTVDITPTAGPPSRVRGLEMLEDAMAACGYGGRAMIHMTAGNAPSLFGFLQMTGNVMSTNLGSIIVPSPGYPGTGPVGNANQTPPAGQTWMYATGIVDVRLTDPVVFPDGDEADSWGNGLPVISQGESYAEQQDAASQPDVDSMNTGQFLRAATRRFDNTVAVRAERLAAATWDGCCAFAVRVVTDS